MFVQSKSTEYIKSLRYILKIPYILKRKTALNEIMKSAVTDK